MSKQITVPIEWFEGLKTHTENVKRTYGTDRELSALNYLVGYIQSAEHIIQGGKDEANKV